MANPVTRIDMTEKELQSAVIDIATRLGFSHYHTHDSRRSAKGFPDLVLASDERQTDEQGFNRVLFVELKAENGRLTDEQMKWAGRMSPIIMPGIDRDVPVIGRVHPDTPHARNGIVPEDIRRGSYLEDDSLTTVRNCVPLIQITMRFPDLDRRTTLIDIVVFNKGPLYHLETQSTLPETRNRIVGNHTIVRIPEIHAISLTIRDLVVRHMISDIIAEYNSY